ncbi:MAG: 2-hydroxyglutaryl-CoA dehydratase [Actinobacteria bacterium]|nr:2-hydroxyglutaryl-CoA dehydratase [Actinomycetota bacterium]MBU1943658.1 2-hydroxyglutaryl-CoA dehydratase [Actinomycetota bacterium]MBU2686198.1 2-hydroxyglutaryl-CoA dehydratase [Actinomycetota bacterium]
MKTMGVDVGNLLSKVVVLDDDVVLASGIMETTGNVAEEIGALVETTLADAGVSREQIERTAGTGSGSELLSGMTFLEDVVTCVAAAGAYYLPEINMVVDCGGQSITSILIDADGDVINFMRNDKCASGSGRFLEVMSNAVGIGLDRIDEAASGAQSPVPISSQCGVFAESEVITHVNAGEQPADIVAGLCDAVSSIVAAQARRFSDGDRYTLTGGVARIAAVNDRIKGKLGGDYYEFPHDPRLAAALGAALLASMD